MIYNDEYEKTTTKKVEPQPIITSYSRSEYEDTEDSVILEIYETITLRLL